MEEGLNPQDDIITWTNYGVTQEVWIILFTIVHQECYIKIVNTTTKKKNSPSWLLF